MPGQELTMRAISTLQPWASLLANGSKKWETRSSNTKVRGEVAICASLKWTGQLQEIALSEPFSSALLGESPTAPGSYEKIMTQTPLGCVVAVGDLVESINVADWLARFPGFDREYRFGNYAPGRAAWRFENMKKLAKPVPVKGAQFWFTLPPEVEAAVRAQL